MERRWLEGLHLCLNTGNGFYELARDMLHYVLLPDGTPRDLNSPDAAAADWPRPRSGSIQQPIWRSLGFDLQALVEEIWGPKLKLPLTKYHGVQVEQLFREQHKLWEHPKLARLGEVKGDAGAAVAAMKDAWGALSSIHKQINMHPANIGVLEEAVSEFRAAVLTLEFPATPSPFRLKRKFYEHAILDHLLTQVRALQSMGLSMAIVSSRFLEANNRTVKARVHTLPGGGRKVEGEYCHDALFLSFTYLTERNFVQRRVAYAQVEEARGERDSQSVGAEGQPRKKKRTVGCGLRRGSIKIEVQ